MIQLNYRDSRPIYEQIKDSLQKLLLSNAIETNEKLPSVRELATSLAINPNTIQRAYRELEADGYIYTIPGKGSFASTKGDLFSQRRKELFVQFDHISLELFDLGETRESLSTYLSNLFEGRIK